MLKQLERREPEGRPECQLLRRTPRMGCGSPKPGAVAGYYKTQNIDPGYMSPRPPFDSPADKPRLPLCTPLISRSAVLSGKLPDVDHLNLSELLKICSLM